MIASGGLKLCREVQTQLVYVMLVVVNNTKADAWLQSAQVVLHMSLLYSSRFVEQLFRAAMHHALSQPDSQAVSARSTTAHDCLQIEPNRFASCSSLNLQT